MCYRPVNVCTDQKRNVGLGTKEIVQDSNWDWDEQGELVIVKIRLNENYIPNEEKTSHSVMGFSLYNLVSFCPISLPVYPSPSSLLNLYCHSLHDFISQQQHWQYSSPSPNYAHPTLHPSQLIHNHYSCMVDQHGSHQGQWLIPLSRILHCMLWVVCRIFFVLRGMPVCWLIDMVYIRMVSSSSGNCS